MHMADEVTQRKDLHDFLKQARARVRPRDLGLTPPPNRRGSGLQQADVAAALSVSPRWYNGFENGTSTADEEMLDRIARILRLTPAERVHLYLLATGHDPAPGSVEPPDAADTVLTRLVHQMGDLAIPALVTDIAWNVLAWNRALVRWFPDPGTRPTAARNVVLWAFSPEIESVVDDAGSFREAHIGWVHLALAGRPDDPRLAHLVDRLQRIPAAERMWNTQQIAGFTNSITPVRFRLADSTEPVEADLLSVEFPGGSRLMMLVPGNGWPARPPAISRLIRRRNHKPPTGTQQGT
jgi:transcriptional regulator with XRE-family HTH domain